MWHSWRVEHRVGVIPIGFFFYLCICRPNREAWQHNPQREEIGDKLIELIVYDACKHWL